MSLNSTVNTFRRKPSTFIPALDKAKVVKQEKDNKKDSRQFGKDLKNISSNSNANLRPSSTNHNIVSKAGFNNLTRDDNNKKKEELIKCTKPKNTPEIIVMPRSNTLLNNSTCITNMKIGDHIKKEMIKSYQKEGELTAMDKLYQGNMLYVTEYVSDIFYHVLASEVRFNPNFFIEQNSILAKLSIETRRNK